jgi:hypothetical protein
LRLVNSAYPFEAGVFRIMNLELYLAIPVNKVIGLLLPFPDKS